MAGGQSMIVVSRSVAPSRRKRAGAPPETGGLGCGDGIQVRHQDALLSQALGLRQAKAPRKTPPEGVASGAAGVYAECEQERHRRQRIAHLGIVERHVDQRYIYGRWN